MEAKLERRPNKHGFEDSIMCRKCKYRAVPGQNGYNTPHYHDHIEMLYGISGISTIIVGNKKYKLNAGELIVINSKYVHDVVCEEGETEQYVIKFIPESLYLRGRGLSEIRYLLPFWQKEMAKEPIISSDVLVEMGLDVTIAEIMKEWKYHSSGYQAMIHSDIMRIFITLVRRSAPNFTDNTNITNELQVILGDVAEKMQDQLCEFTAADAAKYCNLSYSYFCSTFKRAYGVSFTAYLESLRLHESERLLLTTDRDITDISASVGFSTTSYFIERFKMAYGVTPKAFRNSLKVKYDEE